MELNSDRPTARAWYALGIVILATLFGFVDRQILILVITPLKLEMHISDAQIGILQGLAPGIFTMIGVLALSWLADRTARQLVLAGCIVAWSIATAACGLAHSFGQLLAGTVAIALGEAALTPVIVSLVPDLFPGKSRITANMIYFGVVLVGAGAGFALGGSIIGWIDAHRAGLPEAVRNLAAWRIAFFAVALPGVPIALATAAIGPVRRLTARADLPSGGSLVVYLRSHGVPVVGFFIANGLFNFSQAASGTWIAVYVMRTLGASAANLGFGLGVALAIGTPVGLLTSWIAARLLAPAYGALAPFRIYQISMIATLIPLFLLLWVTAPWHVYVLYTILIMVITAGTALITTLLQDVSPVDIRGRLVGLSTVISYTSTSLAPIVVGIVSDMISGRSNGLLWAIVSVSLPSQFAAVVLLKVIEKRFRRTVEELTPTKDYLQPA